MSWEISLFTNASRLDIIPPMGRADCEIVIQRLDGRRGCYEGPAKGTRQYHVIEPQNAPVGEKKKCVCCFIRTAVCVHGASEYDTGSGGEMVL